MTPMPARILAHALLRAAVLAVLLAAYDPVYERLIPTSTADDGLGEGLLAFTMIAMICFAWGVLDGLCSSPAVWSTGWVLAGVIVGVGWELVTEGGSVGRMEPGSVEFMAQLVVVPALGGVVLAWAVGWLSRRSAQG